MSISIKNLTINSNVENSTSEASSVEDGLQSQTLTETDIASLRKELYNECRRMIRYEIERTKER